MTLAAVARMDPIKIIDALSEERLGFLQRLRTWRLFGRGWKARVVHVHADALAMARSPSTESGVPAIPPQTVSVRVNVDASAAKETLAALSEMASAAATQVKAATTGAAAPGPFGLPPVTLSPAPPLPTLDPPPRIAQGDA